MLKNEVPPSTLALVVALAGTYLYAVNPLRAQPVHAPSSRVSIEVWCEDDRKRPVPNCSMSIQTRPRQYSNAHLHMGGNQPVSLLGTSETGPFSEHIIVNTGSRGKTTVWLKTHTVGQAEDLLACSARGCIAQTYFIGYNNFVEVLENNLWFHVGGSTTNHGDNRWNHWMTPSAMRKLTATVASFKSKNPSLGKLAVNDMSLPLGGTFDIRRNWRPPHEEHSIGTAVDIRGNGGPGSIPPSKLADFVAECRLKGATSAIAEGSGSNRHVHCKW